MRRKLIAGNWKMNGLRAEATALAEGLVSRLADGGPDCDWLVCPPFTAIAPVGEYLDGSAIALGGQDCHSAAKGAHTGDVSAPMLADLGCRYVIVGHSERRHGHGEDSTLVRLKAQAAQAAGLVPIVCVGETERERDAGKTLAVLEEQIDASLPETVGGELVVAYEPVWAIGTGKAATPDDIAEAHAHIRGLLKRRFAAAGEEARILYGGSVKADNAGALLRVANVDGALVGGASLKVDEFWAIGSACP